MQAHFFYFQFLLISSLTLKNFKTNSLQSWGKNPTLRKEVEFLKRSTHY